MSLSAVIAAASWVETLGLDGGSAFFVPLSLALLLICVSLIVLTVLSRRRMMREIRQIVLDMEEVRSRRSRRRIELDRDSPLALVGDALNRLRQDVDSRLHDAENAAERLHAVQDAVRDSAVVTTDNDGDIRSFSPGAGTLFGWSEDEVLGKPASLLFDENAYQQFLPKLARRSLREEGIDSRASLVRRDGSGFPADVSVRMLRNAAREGIGFVLVVRDVTRQAALESELKESERRYRGLVEGLGDGVLIVRDGIVLYANPAFAALSGLTAAQLLNIRLRDRIATGDVMLVEETLSTLQQRAHGEEQLRCRVLGPDPGSQLQVGLTAVGIDYLGQPGVLLLVRDETPERRIEAELRRNESQLDAVVESATDGIIVIADGANGGVVRMTNRAFTEMLQVSRREVLGLSLGSLVGLLSQRGDGASRLAGLLAEGDTAARETVMLGSPPREVEVSVAALCDRRGEALGRVMACRDLTEERESQRKLQQHAEELQLSKVMLEQAYRRLDAANKNLESRGEELDELNSELRTLDEMKSNLLGNVTHELQTPLVSIRGYTEMTLKERLGPLTAEQRKGLTLCLKNIDRLISMIDNLLAFNRAEPELGDLKLSRFPVKELIDEAVALLREKIQSRAVRFVGIVDPADLCAQADRDRILQVFLNLLSNAVKFNRQGGRIDVEARPGKPGFVEVRVEDTGVGIPAAEVDRIFDRNYQAGPGAGREGSGIGLAIVRDVLRLHGCRINVQSVEEQGTRFTFTLPASAEQVESVEENPHPARTDSPVPPSFVGETPAEEAPPVAEETASEVGSVPEVEAVPEAESEPATGEGPEPPAPRPRFRVIRRGPS